MPLLDSESTEQKSEATETETTDEAPVETHSRGFRLARVLFGGVLAFTALDNFRDLDEMIAYAKGKDAPMPERTVPAISGTLLFGGGGIALWKLPTLAAGAVATFLVSTTPFMHDFWNVEDDQQREQQMTHFLKNAALLGGALAFMRVARDD
ncbi:DoxX family protein [Halomicrococcus sp. SG-WS-1]|uniref:DoxX family protein n=1 Tax=Halomicrococcus sp. SG-WS-1 TaxID=3439057 RepID=UPI003F79083A